MSKMAKFINTLKHVDPPTLCRTTTMNYDNERYCKGSHCVVIRSICNAPDMLISNEFCVNIFNNKIPDNKRKLLENLLHYHFYRK